MADKVCKLCGAVIVGRWKNAQYCSRTCQRDAQIENMLARYHAKRLRFTHPVRVCKQAACGKSFTPSHGGQRYCSPACYPANHHRHYAYQKSAAFARKLKGLS